MNVEDSKDIISDVQIESLIRAFYEAHGVEPRDDDDYMDQAERHWMREALIGTGLLDEIVRLRGIALRLAGDRADLSFKLEQMRRDRDTEHAIAENWKARAETWKERAFEITNRNAALTRLSVIDYARGGLVYERYSANLDMHYQDDGRTLKIFVTPAGVQERADKLREIQARAQRDTECSLLRNRYPHEPHKWDIDDRDKLQRECPGLKKETP